jgi:endonuclease I
MKKILLVTSVVLFAFTTSIYGQPPSGYYNSAEGKTGYTLKTALYNIIKNHQDQGYSALWEFYKTGDILPANLTNSGTSTNRIWDIYSYNPNGQNPYEYIKGSDQCGNYNGEGSCYNREHTFPKSWFNNAAPMKNDVVHILPTDGYTNGRRSNYPYSEVGSTTWVSQNGSRLGSSNVSGFSGTAFEPIDEFKGDLARVYFYMATRYENVIANWENNSSNADVVLDGTRDHVYEQWYLDLMVKWSNEDPVSDKELNRNNKIYNFQHNRNPFVDHPEYITLIWVDPTAVINPLELKLSIYPNPVVNELHVSYSSDEPLTYFIVNMSGQKVESGVLHGRQSNIEVNQYHNGLYLIVVKSKDGKQVKQFKFLKAS